MHPRNIYKKPADFKKLAIKYPNFCKFVKIDLSGTAKLDFKNPAALAELTKTLLLEDFKLRVEIPIDKLVPTLPLRLNYILWIEDLLANVNSLEINGIDVGTGASCIYPLLGASKGWHMLGTEIDETSVEIAEKNIKQNELDHLIRVKKVDKSDYLLRNLVEGSCQFCMCNPPFFDQGEVPENRSFARKEPSNGKTGVQGELETDGGEVGFVLRMFEDSLELKEKISIYTSMIGKLSSLKILKGRIQKLGVKSWTYTEFRQGKTTRWGLAWSFSHNLPVPKKEPKPLVFDLPMGTNFDYSVQLIKKLTNELKMELIDIQAVDKKFTATVRAFENTWSNQRRKRREMERNAAKKPKLDIEKTTPILEFYLKCYEIDDVVSIETKWSSGPLEKDSVHQILQYFKNNWKIEKI